ncbi:DddA-like double-stranded DNA deaminase toxin [Saccharothrix xinjiangensis]|uniref:DddA-like double-stranded DNA deaminase toxin n=1 Tax=Saccharothrix xinjiangensis TaxID=204798 RepID=A0ABV9YB66_9PSEU
MAQEGKSAYLLNHWGVQYAVLVINNKEGPCASVSGVGCSGLTAKAIPLGATLVVWWGDPDADPMTVQSRAFHNPVDDDQDGKKKKGRR